MKKIYKLLSSSALCASVLVNISTRVSAQYIPGGLSFPYGSIPVTHIPVWNHPVDNSRAITGKWLEYWHVEDSLGVANGNTPTGAVEFLFPDSGVIACTPTGITCVAPIVHLIANVLDPNSADMQQVDGYSWANTNPYTVDSLAIRYAYSRKSTPDVVDTLIAYLWDNAVSSDINTTTFGLIFPHGTSPYGTDTIICAGLYYDSTGTNMPKVSANALKTFKIPLTASDTATLGVNFGVKVINTMNFSVPMGKIVASAFSFKPGYVYQKGDTIPNAFGFYSDQPNGTGSCATYTKGDWNESLIINNDVRYSLNQEHFDGVFLPSWVFSCAGYPIQEHEISYYVSGVFDVGINESVSSEGLKLYQSQPNPTNHSALVAYETQIAGTVTLEVRDLTGRLVMELNQGIQSGGKHNVVIDVSGMSKGMYLYTLKTKNESLTRRMIVSE